MRYQWRREYVNEEGKTGKFFDILPHELTLSRRSLYYISQPVNIHETMFKEVRIKPYEPNDFVGKAIRTVDKIIPIVDKSWKYKVYNCLLDIIEQTWDRSRFHVIAHSSGIDSRILSSIIKTLGFTDLLFVECAGEADLFKKIMQAQGWPASKYKVFREGHDKGDYFSHSFECIPDSFNGPVGYPVNHFYDAYDELIANGDIPEDAQFFSAFGGYIEKCIQELPAKEFFRRDYYYQMNAFEMRGEWIFPWWDIRYLKEIARYNECYDKVRVSDRLNDILPEKVRRIRKYKTFDVIRRGWRTVGYDLLMKLRDKAASTWYGKRKNVNLKPGIEYSNSWGHFCEAMICEKLIKQGYEIR